MVVVAVPSYGNHFGQDSAQLWPGVGKHRPKQRSCVGKS